MTDRTTYRQRVATVRGRARAQLAAIRKERLARMRVGPEISEEIAAAWAADRLEDTVGRMSGPPKIAVVPDPVPPEPEEAPVAAGFAHGAEEPPADPCAALAEEPADGGTDVAPAVPVDVDGPAPAADHGPAGDRLAEAASDVDGPVAEEAQALETHQSAGGSCEELSAPDDDGAPVGAVVPTAEEGTATPHATDAREQASPEQRLAPAPVDPDSRSPAEHHVRAIVAEVRDAPSAGQDPSADPDAGQLDAGHRAHDPEEAAGIAEPGETTAEAPDARGPVDNLATARDDAALSPMDIDVPHHCVTAPASPPAAPDTQGAVTLAEQLPASDADHSDPSMCDPRGESDLHAIPGIGPGLVWMMQEAGVRTLDDLAAADPRDLAQRLGAIARLLDLDYFVTFARTRGDAC